MVDTYCSTLLLAVVLSDLCSVVSRAPTERADLVNLHCAVSSSMSVQGMQLTSASKEICGSLWFERGKLLQHIAIIHVNRSCCSFPSCASLLPVQVHRHRHIHPCCHTSWLPKDKHDASSAQ
jgi:hypothetical protein